MPFANPAEVAEQLAAVGYLADQQAAVTVYVADRLSKPVLCEGPAGVGKTELAKALAEATGRSLIRLQCYEGLDEAKAIYEWNYKKQLLRIQTDAGERDWHQVEQDIFTEDFL
ncbi:MAG: AAA family ATPase, partial [Actinomycetota bacterium]